ncbi:hypothetical protein JCM6882_009242 [Rhodosporidiobolus microsporus]
MPSAKPPPPPAPGQPQLRFTSFAPVGFLNAKNVASSFSRTDSQSWYARRSSEQEWNAQREGKRRRLMASEDEIQAEQARVGEAAAADGRVKVGTLVKAPEGGVKAGKVAPAGEEAQPPADPLSRTIIIHPGSRFLRIGRASDIAPVSVPNVIARKLRGGQRAVPARSSSLKGKERAEPVGTAVEGASSSVLSGVAAPPVIKPEEVVAQVQAQAAPSAPPPAAAAAAGPSFGGLPSLPPSASQQTNGDVSMRSSPLSSPREPDLDADSNPDDDDDASPRATPSLHPSSGHAAADPLEAKIASLKGDLRARMRVFKLRGQGNGNSQASQFNETVVVQEMEEGFEEGGGRDIEWTVGEGDAYVGNKAVRIPDPVSSNYLLRYPFDRGAFNTAAGAAEGLPYNSAQELLGDVEAIIVGVLEEELGFAREELKDYSAILLIPDLYDQTYVREMTDLLLRTIGFKQLCLQQESVCATFGAGVASACVIDIGAKTSTITCVEEGLVLPETRMVLDFGGDDITAFLLTLLLRINFPYKEADLTKWYDWVVIEDLKERLVVLSEGDIGLNLYDFYVRHPGETTKKYSMRVYDDCIMAPYALFAPRVIDFEQKKVENQPSLWDKDVDDHVEIGAVSITNAMRNSTRHLSHPQSLPGASSLSAPADASASTGTSPAPAGASGSQSGTPVVDDPNSAAFSTLPNVNALPNIPTFGALPTTTPAAGSPAPAEGTATPTASAKLPSASAASAAAKSGAPPAATPPVGSTVQIDVRRESSKLPLDVAVVESILAAGPAEERMKRVAANLLVVGGTGGIHNVGFAVESRVAPALIARAPFLAPTSAANAPAQTITYVPCPREVEPENLAWKGIASLAKLDCANELWVRKEEWEGLGMRAVRERAFYWA